MSIDDVCEHSSPLHFGFRPLNVAKRTQSYVEIILQWMVTRFVMLWYSFLNMAHRTSWDYHHSPSESHPEFGYFFASALVVSAVRSIFCTEWYSATPIPDRKVSVNTSAARPIAISQVQSQPFGMSTNQPLWHLTWNRPGKCHAREHRILKDLHL